MSSFHFTVRINSKSFPSDVRSVQKVPTQIFGNVRCPILCIKTNSTPQCWCGLATNILEKSRLNWKLKISNAADRDITQSQARDTRHRRMQEVNSLCADSWPLRANIVLRHSTKYSLLVVDYSFTSNSTQIRSPWRGSSQLISWFGTEVAMQSAILIQYFRLSVCLFICHAGKWTVDKSYSQRSYVTCILCFIYYIKIK